MALGSKGFRGPFLVADARAIHGAGGTPAQELAFALGAAVGGLRLLESAGTPLSEARRLVAFRLAADADELATLSKFRALRILWSRVEEACGLEPRAAHVQAESAWRMMTARDVYVNVMRGATAAFAAGLGGADSVAVLPHTLAVGFPDSLARRLARNGQLILLREANLGFVGDPAAGAGAFEAMTRALCDKAWALFQAIEAEGGLPSALAKRRLSAPGRRQRGGAGPRRRPAEVADHRRQRPRRSFRAAGRDHRWRARARGVCFRGRARADSARRAIRASARSVRRLSRANRQAAESLSRRAGPRVHASAPRRIRARVGRGRRLRGCLRWRDRNGRRGGRALASERRRRSCAYAGATRLMPDRGKPSPRRSGIRARRASRLPGARARSRPPGAPRASTISSSPARTRSRRLSASIAALGSRAKPLRLRPHEPDPRLRQRALRGSIEADRRRRLASLARARGH